MQVTHDYNSHLWCGIGALSAALNITTTQAREHIKRTALRTHIKAITYSELAGALAEAGHTVRREYYPRNANECPLLKDWHECEAGEYNRIYAVCITGHWIVVCNDHWVDSMNHTKRPMDSCPYLRARVRHVVSFQPGDES